MRFHLIKILSIVGIFSTMLFSCKNKMEDVRAVTNIESYPDLMSENIELMYSDSARVMLKVSAPKVLRYENEENPYTEFPKGIKVIFYDNAGDIDATITSQYAIYTEKDDLWHATKDVVAINHKENKILNTEELFWNMEEERIYSDKHVRITSDEEIVYGKGFESDQSFDNWTIKGIENSSISVEE